MRPNFFVKVPTRWQWHKFHHLGHLPLTLPRRSNHSDTPIFTWQDYYCKDQTGSDLISIQQIYAVWRRSRYNPRKCEWRKERKATLKLIWEICADDIRLVLVQSKFKCNGFTTIVGICVDMCGRCG